MLKPKAVKFRIGLWKIFNDLTLSEEDWIKAANYARDKNLIILADIFGDEGFNDSFFST